MKLTILGSGSAYGTPMIFNQWHNSNPQNPKNQRTRPSLFLEIENKHILIDASPDLRLQINTNNINNIDAVFLTHGHYDHICGIPELPRACKLLGHGINLYASTETLNEVQNCYGYLFNTQAEAEPDLKSLNWITIPNCGRFEALGLKFQALQVHHHNLCPSAYRYNNFAYVPDWETIDEDMLSSLSGLDLLVVECNNGLVTEKNGHSDINNIKKLVEIIKPQEVILTHLSARVDYDELSSYIPKNFTVAYDGLSLNI